MISSASYDTGQASKETLPSEIWSWERHDMMGRKVLRLLWKNLKEEFERVRILKFPNIDEMSKKSFQNLLKCFLEDYFDSSLILWQQQF